MTNNAIDTVCWFLFGEKDESWRQPLLRKMYRFLIATFIKVRKEDALKIIGE